MIAAEAAGMSAEDKPSRPNVMPEPISAPATPNDVAAISHSQKKIKIKITGTQHSQQTAVEKRTNDQPQPSTKLHHPEEGERMTQLQRASTDY
jgi:hypothetical protein